MKSFALLYFGTKPGFNRRFVRLYIKHLIYFVCSFWEKNPQNSLFCLFRKPLAIVNEQKKKKELHIE